MPVVQSRPAFNPDSCVYHSCCLISTIRETANVYWDRQLERWFVCGEDISASSLELVGTFQEMMDQYRQTLEYRRETVVVRECP